MACKDVPTKSIALPDVPAARRTREPRLVRRLRLLFPVVAIALLLTAMLGASQAHAADAPLRMSVGFEGAESDGASGWWYTSVSADGRYVAFNSIASNLAGADVNSGGDVFVRDTLTGLTTCVSVNAEGWPGDAGSMHPSISADGRFVAFHSFSKNLVGHDSNNTADVFVRDIVDGTTTRASVGVHDAQANGFSDDAAISGNGRFVAFASRASNLVAGDTNDSVDVFVYDTESKTTERVSVDTSGAQGNEDSWLPSVSEDGRYVAFTSRASNLVPGDTNGKSDVFVRDRVENTTKRVSVNSSRDQGNGSSTSAAISADGRYVAMHSWATNLVRNDVNGAADVFVHDTHNGETVCASDDPAVTHANVANEWPRISANGRYVVFHSTILDEPATEPVADKPESMETTVTRDVYVRDLAMGRTVCLSVDASGTPLGAQSEYPSITSDGRFVVFNSAADDLVADDANQTMDVFLAAVPITDKSVVFDDPNLEAAVKAALGVPADVPIIESDMLRLTSLNAEGLGITDLTGLEFATNLTSLNLGSNNITDLSPLASLENLQNLWLPNNGASDLSPLSGLAHLRHLNLASNEVFNLAPLANLAQLETLELSSNQVSDLNPLAGLASLWHLGLDHNQVSDISPLLANTGIDAGDRLVIFDNLLDLTSEGEDMAVINTLVARGVNVSFQSPSADTTAPEITVPEDIVVETTDPLGAVVDFEVSAYDVTDGPVAASAIPGAGSVFPVGTTVVVVTAQDSHGNAASKNFWVTVNLVEVPPAAPEETPTAGQAVSSLDTGAATGNSATAAP